MKKVFLSVGTVPSTWLAAARQFAREDFRILRCARNIHWLNAKVEKHQFDVSYVNIRPIDSSGAQHVMSSLMLIAACYKYFIALRKFRLVTLWAVL